MGTEPDDVGLEDDHYIQFDLNPHIQNFIVVDNVAEKNGKVVGLDPKPQRLMAMGLADIYEICRVAFFHAALLQCAEEKVQWMTLYERIVDEEKAMQSTGTADLATKFRDTLLHKVSDWCTQAEFKAYWELKSQHKNAL